MLELEVRLPSSLVDGGVHHPAQGLGLVDLLGDTLSTKRCLSSKYGCQAPWWMAVYTIQTRGLDSSISLAIPSVKERLEDTLLDGEL